MFIVGLGMFICHGHELPFISDLDVHAWMDGLCRGENCNTPSHYCNGSLTFWCVDNLNNSTCNVTADGNFTCSCLPGFAGAQCELTGTACGDGSYCYNNATCLGGGSCSCPSDWQGNANCSLASPEGLSSGGSHIKVI